MPSLAIMIAKKKQPDEDPEMDPSDDSGEHDKDDTKQAVMSALIDAIHDKDVDAACQAFEDLSDLCADQEDK